MIVRISPIRLRASTFEQHLSAVDHGCRLPGLRICRRRAGRFSRVRRFWYRRRSRTHRTTAVHIRRRAGTFDRRPATRFVTSRTCWTRLHRRIRCGGSRSGRTPCAAVHRENRGRCHRTGKYPTDSRPIQWDEHRARETCDTSGGQNAGRAGDVPPPRHLNRPRPCRGQSRPRRQCTRRWTDQRTRRIRPHTR